MKDLYGEICDLAIKKNQGVSFDVLFAVLGNKMNDLVREMQHYNQNLSHGKEDILIEMGKVQIIIFELMQKYSVCADSFEDAVRIQHMVNIGRFNEKEDE